MGRAVEVLEPRDAKQDVFPCVLSRSQSQYIRVRESNKPNQSNHHGPPLPPREAAVGGQGLALQPQDGQDRGPGDSLRPRRRRRRQERRCGPQPSLGRFGPRQPRGSASSAGSGGSIRSRCRRRRSSGRSTNGRDRHVRSVPAGQADGRSVPVQQQAFSRLGKFA